MRKVALRKRSDSKRLSKKCIFAHFFLNIAFDITKKCTDTINAQALFYERS